MRCVLSVLKVTLSGLLILSHVLYTMNNLRESVEALIYHQLGIVPLSYDDRDVNRILSSLPADEAMRMKRKFRKLWRKESNCQLQSHTKSGRQFATRYKAQSGHGEVKPTKAQKRNRKFIVIRRVKIMANAMLEQISGSHVKELTPVL